MDIGKIIKENRSSKNMTQEDLANEFFVSRQLISKWENGKSYPDLEQLLKLSTFLNCWKETRGFNPEMNSNGFYFVD